MAHCIMHIMHLGKAEDEAKTTNDVDCLPQVRLDDIFTVLQRTSRAYSFCCDIATARCIEILHALWHLK